VVRTSPGSSSADQVEVPAERIGVEPELEQGDQASPFGSGK
jgi:hypothetical protein